MSPSTQGNHAHALPATQATAQSLGCSAPVDSPAPDTNSADGTVTIEARRRLVALEAAWELDAIGRALPGLVPSDADSEQVYAAQLLVRAMSGRLLRLAHVLMVVLDDDIDTTESLENIIDLKGGQG